MKPSNRRAWFSSTLGALGAGATLLSSVAKSSPSALVPDPPSSFKYCLNTSTISGQKLTLVQELQLAAKAGYDAVEPWLREIDAHVEAGGTLKDLGKLVADLGLQIPSAIGFAEWVVDDDARRAKGLDVMKSDMEKVRAIGGTRIAAPPSGATDQDNLNLNAAADRYRVILEAGEGLGVIPQVEVWGFSRSVSRLGEAAMIAIGANHPQACILADVYHLYRGGSDFNGIKLLNGKAMHVFHMNDYPDMPARAKISDADRVFPGTGIAPLTALLRDLRSIGYQGYLSLELFNREYWKLDASQVVNEGLSRMKTAVATAMEA